jgi:hypothetical protein
MRTHIRLVAACLLLVAVASLAGAQQPPTKILRVILTTDLMQPMKIPGMENLPNMPNLPAMFKAQVQHTISAVAQYDTAAVEPIFLTVPADLQLANNHLDLHVSKPATEAGEGQGDEGGETRKQTMEVVTKIYWHPDEAQGPISETVKIQTGQGQRGGAGRMSAPDLSRLLGDMLDRQATGSETKLPQTVKGAGNYVLNTAGTAALDGFLGALKVSSPDMSKLDLEKPISVEWEAIAGARGYFIMATGMNMEGAGEDNAKMTSISWYSTLQEPPVRVRGGYVQETTIADDLKMGVLLPGNTTACVIPAGIFKGVSMLTLRVQAIGNDFYSNEGGRTVIGTIRSEWRAMSMVEAGGAMNDQ